MQQKQQLTGMIFNTLKAHLLSYDSFDSEFPKTSGIISNSHACSVFDKGRSQRSPCMPCYGTPYFVSESVRNTRVATAIARLIRPKAEDAPTDTKTPAKSHTVINVAHLLGRLPVILPPPAIML